MMPRPNRSNRDMWPSREDQCPKREPGLTHIQDGSTECVHCGQAVRAPTASEKAKKAEVDPNHTEPADDCRHCAKITRAIVKEREKSSDAGDFTDDEVRHFEFLRSLRRDGRI